MTFWNDFVIVYYLLYYNFLVDYAEEMKIHQVLAYSLVWVNNFQGHEIQAVLSSFFHDDILRKKLSFLRLIIIMIFPCNRIVRNVRNSKFNKMYMELCKELSPFVGISVTEIKYECAYLQ